MEKTLPQLVLEDTAIWGIFFICFKKHVKFCKTLRASKELKPQVIFFTTPQETCFSLQLANIHITLSLSGKKCHLEIPQVIVTTAKEKKTFVNQEGIQAFSHFKAFQNGLQECTKSSERTILLASNCKHLQFFFFFISIQCSYKCSCSAHGRVRTDCCHTRYQSKKEPVYLFFDVAFCCSVSIGFICF